MKRIWLRDARRKAKLTQAELASRIGKPQSFISKLESGENDDPRVSEASAIAAALSDAGLSVDALALRFGRREVAA